MKKLLATILSVSMVMVLGMGLVGCTPEKKKEEKKVEKTTTTTPDDKTKTETKTELKSEVKTDSAKKTP